MSRSATPLKPIVPRSKKGAETRTRLLEAAKREFEEVGFLDARISDISKRAGLSHGAFYHYFESKEQIFRELAEEQERLLTVRRRESGPAEGTYRERVRMGTRWYLEHYRDEARFMGVIEQVSRYDEHVHAARMATDKAYANWSEGLIRGLQDEGLADPDIDPAIAAVALGAMVARFAELWLVHGYADYDFEEAVEQLSRLSFNALRVEEDPR